MMMAVRVSPADLVILAHWGRVSTWLRQNLPPVGFDVHGDLSSRTPVQFDAASFTQGLDSCVDTPPFPSNHLGQLGAVGRMKIEVCEVL